MKTLTKKSLLAVAITTLAACSAVPEGEEGQRVDPTQVQSANEFPYGHESWKNSFPEGQRPMDIMRGDLKQVTDLTGEGVSVLTFGYGLPRGVYIGESFSNKNMWFVYGEDGETLEPQPANNYVGNYHHDADSYCAMYHLSFGQTPDVDLTVHRMQLDIDGPKGVTPDFNKIRNFLEQQPITEDFVLINQNSRYYSQTMSEEKARELAANDIGLIVLPQIKTLDSRINQYVEDVFFEDFMQESLLIVGRADAYMPSRGNVGSTGKGNLDRLIVLPDVDKYAPSNANQHALRCGEGEKAATALATAAAVKVKEKFPQLSNKAVLQVLLDTADKTSPYYQKRLHGQGLLDLEAALNIDPNDYM